MNPSNRFLNSISRIQMRPGLIFGLIILSALAAFEMFNYSTTEYALRDLLGPLAFLGLPWATILSLAFCGIDFAGIARLFTPDRSNDQSKEAWYLFGAWMLAATMNAILTWWGVSMAITSHKPAAISVIDPTTLTKVIPVFVALMVWVIRILIIGTLSAAGNHLLVGSKPTSSNFARRQPVVDDQSSRTNFPSRPSSSNAIPRPSFRPNLTVDASGRPEPTYHSLNAAPSPGSNRTFSDPPK